LRLSTSNKVYDDDDGMRGFEEQKSPSRIQGQNAGGGLGAKLPEVDNIFSK